MKKVLFFAAIGLAVMATSCKKEYECCYYVAGEKVEGEAAYPCQTTKLSKKEKDELEENTSTEIFGVPIAYKCEE